MRFEGGVFPTESIAIQHRQRLWKVYEASRAAHAQSWQLCKKKVCSPLYVLSVLSFNEHHRLSKSPKFQVPQEETTLSRKDETSLTHMFGFPMSRNLGRRVWLNSQWLRHSCRTHARP